MKRNRSSSSRSSDSSNTRSSKQLNKSRKLYDSANVKLTDAQLAVLRSDIITNLYKIWGYRTYPSDNDTHSNFEYITNTNLNVGRLIQYYTDPIFRTLQQIDVGQNHMYGDDINIFLKRDEIDPIYKEEVVDFFNGLSLNGKRFHKGFFESPGVEEGFDVLRKYCDDNPSDLTTVLNGAITALRALARGALKRAAKVFPLPCKR
jgi:hypothetical protein